MGKRWRPYSAGGYRLGYLLGDACALWRDSDGRHRYRLGPAATEGEARALLDRFAQDRALILARQAPRATVGDIWRRYYADREADGKVMRTFRDHWRALAPTFEAMPLDAITDDACRAYTAARVAAGCSTGTPWTELTRLRSALNWAEKRRIIDRAPYVWLPAKPPPRDRVLTVEELERLLAACVMPHVALFVELAIGTGARSGALLELPWEQVDLSTEPGSIDLRNVEPVSPLQKRARKHRAVVPVVGRLRAVLDQARTAALSDFVIEWNGERVASIRRGFSEACRRAGLDGVTPHTLRHTAASWAVAEGMDMERVSRWLGHRDVSTTRRIYAHTGADYTAPVAEAVAQRALRVVRK